MVQYSFTSTETRRLVRTDSPGRDSGIMSLNKTCMFCKRTVLLVLSVVRKFVSWQWWPRRDNSHCHDTNLYTTLNTNKFARLRFISSILLKQFSNYNWQRTKNHTLPFINTKITVTMKQNVSQLAIIQTFFSFSWTRRGRVLLKSRRELWMKQWSTALPVCTFLGCPAGIDDLGRRANPGQTLGTAPPRGHGRNNSSFLIFPEFVTGKTHPLRDN